MASTGTGKTSQPGAGKKENFDPADYLEQRNKSAYLPLKWQLVWLRREHPQAEVRTNLVSRDHGVAIFQAEIKLPDGGVATGWGAQAQVQDSEESYPDLGYLTLAENQALARALSALGYGTEYAQDFDPPAESVPITLPANVTYNPEEEEASIEVPLTPEDEIAEVTPAASLGEVRATYENGARLRVVPPVEETEAEPVPEPAPRIEPVPEPAPVPLPERPVPVERPAPAPVEARKTPQIGNPTVDERIKGIEDSQLRILIKQIYAEASRLHNISVETVDKRSRDRFGRPTYELNVDEATEYLERIQNARPRGANR